ncbi:MAG: hypothetical protein ABIM99_02890 [Candidatus Dojkabacteria bacterium]
MNETNTLPKIGAPAIRALRSVGVTKLEQLTKFTKKQLLSLHGFGPKALKILEEELKKINLSFQK